MRLSLLGRRATALVGLLAVCAAVPVSAQTFYQASPTGSFYRTSSEVPGAPVIISLADFLGATSLMLTPRGQLQVAGAGSPVHDAVFCGVFSTSTTLLASNVQQRVTGALASTAATTSPCETGNTFYGGAPTNLAEDFFIPFAGLEIDVPTGANYLYVSVFDDFYSDNVSPDPSQYGIVVTASVPEPSTATLVVSGVAWLVAVRRQRRGTSLAHRLSGGSE